MAFFVGAIGYRAPLPPIRARATRDALWRKVRDKTPHRRIGAPYPTIVFQCQQAVRQVMHRVDNPGDTMPAFIFRRRRYSQQAERAGQKHKPNRKQPDNQAEFLNIALKSRNKKSFGREIDN